MATITMNGGPWTDGLGNKLDGDWSFNPDARLGGPSDIILQPNFGRLSAGAFSTLIPEGTYLFTLRTNSLLVSQEVVIAIAGGSTQTIESLIT